ncbi:MAG: TRAP transporter substrate-binding protein DctP [Desulfobacterales bacterium]|nr:MAG: TRAP transporter substrate-binding protein DctP [Desulfobacterales bacterium]
MKRILLRSSVMIFLVIMMTVIAMPVMSAEKSFKWRMATLYPRGTAFGEVYEAFCDNVKAMSEGQLTITMVYDGEGVPATEVLSATRSGLVEMGSPYQALHAGELPAGIVELGLPGGPDQFLELVALFQESGWDRVLRDAYAAYGVFWLSPFYQPATYMLTKKPINALDDLKGLKIRGVGAYGKVMQQFGMSPVTMAFAETYTSLATGVIDATCGSNLIDFRDGKWHEQAKYLYPLPLTGSQVAPFIVNMNAWKKLPEDLQKILLTAGNWAGVDMRIKSLMWEKAALQEMIDGGLTWSPAPSPEDAAKWQEAGKKIWPEYAAKDKYSKELLDAQDAFMKKLGR